MYELLKDILVSKLHVDPEQITPLATRDDIELDSLALVELSLVMEKEWGVAVSDDELAQAPTVGDIVALLETRSSGAPASS